MGIFFEQSDDSASWSERLAPHVRAALADAPDVDAQALTNEIAASISRAPKRPARFKAGRFVGALLIFVVLAGSGVVADVFNHASSSNALFGFAGTIFGVVTAFLGAEKSATG